MGLGGTHHENRPFRRLFKRFEKSVEGLGRDLVGFVDDEDFVAVACRPVADVLAELAHFIDAAIGGGVDFDYVRRISGGNFDTTGALATRRGCWPFDAIQAAGKDACDSGFPGTSLSGKDVPVGDTPL